MDLDPTLLTWAFVVGGVLLMLIEAVVPGGIAFFLGIGGVVVGGLRGMGLLVDPLSSVVTWVFLSTGLTIALRPLMLRFVRGDVSLAMTDEDAEAMGETVTVLEPVGPESPGRIRFRGAGWDARTLEGRLPEGAEAQLLYRDNLTWVVEPAAHADLDAELSEAIGSDVSKRSADRSSGTDDATSEGSGLGYDPSARSPS
ncbi:NfeD family protein [Salinibacter altiplanensis]|uniref:NfeD family protein n=1 Tax=Salinibacter altiplanensis TaxID=1803181 RepID=UPI000C9FE18A|nr:NfeD family protein [Salinibacter altiplanensis]